MDTILEQTPIRIIHYAVSVSFLIFAIAIVYKSIIGVIKKKTYDKIDKFLSYAFIFTLYLQLILGLVLFSNLGTNEGFSYLHGEETIRSVNKRLWPIEHIVLMLFALFIANLGLISSIKTEKSFSKHKKTLIYYSISILLIAFSMISVYIL